MSSDVTNGSYKTENSELTGHLMNWLSVSADNVVILILLIALSVKFIFFEDKSDIVKRLRFKKEEEEIKKKMDLNSFDLDNANTVAMDISLQQQFGRTSPIQQSSIFPLSGVGGGWAEINDNEESVEYVDKEVQTDMKYFDNGSSSPKKSEVPRSVEDCLEIYKSEVRIFNTQNIY